MKYFRHEVKTKQATIYPFVCMHVGVEQSDDTFIRQHIKRVLADPNGYAVYMGDAGECTLKNSKGDIYQQQMSPGAQLDYACELLEPLASKDKLLWGIKGNHGNRIYKETGLDWDEMLCSRLGIPYCHNSVFMRLVATKIHYDLYFHHGAGGSILTSTKIGKALKFNPLVEADAVFTAHTHICCENPVETIAFLPPSVRKVSWRTKHSYICGCGYDSRTGYAENRGYPPIIAAYLGVTFWGHTNHRKTHTTQKKQTCQIWRSDP
jgi:hypothetical protein